MRAFLQEKAIHLLRWSEKYTKTDMVYLASGGFWLMLGYTGQMVLGLILAVALTRLLPKEAYGTYQFVISVCAIIGGFTLSGMGTALMRSVARGSRGSLRYAFTTQLVWSSGIVLAAGTTALYYFVNGNSELALAFLLSGICLPLLSGFSLYRPYLEGKQLFRESTMLGMWRRPLPVIAVIIALLLTKDPIILVITYFASQTISMGLLYWLIVRKYPEPAEANPELSNYSKHLSVMNIVSLITNNLDKLLVFHYLGAAPVAIYTLAQLPFAQINRMFGLIGSLIFPKFARQDFDTLRKSLSHKTLIFSLATTAIVAIYIFVSPYIFTLLFPAYPEAVLLSQVLILALLVKPATLYGQVFSAHGLKHIQYFVQISTTVLKLALLVALLPLYGLWGAVGVTLVMSLYWALIVALLFYTSNAKRNSYGL